jgi:hypothetical protein
MHSNMQTAQSIRIIMVGTTNTTQLGNKIISLPLSSYVAHLFLYTTSALDVIHFNVL